jgi:ABC-type tungstate transport system permease subunit
LLFPFEKECHCKVDVIVVGAGKALKLGEAEEFRTARPSWSI